MIFNSRFQKQIVNYKCYGYYNNYNDYKLGENMSNTTISITQETKKHYFNLGQKVKPMIP